MAYQLVQFHARQDNIGSLIICRDSAICIAIDAPDANAIEKALSEHNVRLTHILITHAHHDHIDGLNALYTHYAPQIIAGKLTAQELAAQQLPPVNRIIEDGQEFQIQEFQMNALIVQALHTPGHRDDHMAYWFKQHNMAACGDVIFKMGCGRAINSLEHILYRSIEQIKQLPDDTVLICGHDYCEANIEFALSLEPHSTTLQALLKTAQNDKANKRLTSITTLKDEKQLNPFLRAHTLNIKQALELTESVSTEETFVALRLRKNTF